VWHSSNEAPQASRRAILSAAPVAAAGALLAGTAVNAAAVAMAEVVEVDPIFAAIAGPRRCLDHMFACYRTATRLSAICPRENCTGSIPYGALASFNRVVLNVQARPMRFLISFAGR
jgi:hypothetical protein